MVGTDTVYFDEIAKWQQVKEDSLRAEDGWLALVGLDWLHEGINSVGANPASDIVLPADSAPDELGAIEFVDGQATLRTSVDVIVDGVPTHAASLRLDTAEGGPSFVKIGTVTFFLIQRGDEYGVRIRDTNNPARVNFAGRKWFPTDPQYRVTGTFVPHEVPRKLQIVSSTGHLVPMTNPGRVEFVLNGQPLFLEAFSASNNEIWFVFKDKTSGVSTYGAGRFMYAPLGADGSVVMDFNKTYHPPCAFTPYATCPLPPKENILPLEISAGEHH